MCHYQPPKNNHSVRLTCCGHLMFICNGLGRVWVAVFTSVTRTRLEPEDWHHYPSKCIICDIITVNAWSVTLVPLQTHHFWCYYFSKCIICDIMITPNTYLWPHYHSTHIICDIIIALNAWSVTSISLQTHHRWHHCCSKCFICDIIITPNASSVTSLSLWILDLWHHYCSKHIICDIIVTLNASSVCGTSRPPPGFQTADDIQRNVSCAQPSSVVKLSTAQICPSNIHPLQCKRTTLCPAQKFPPV